MTFQQFWDAVNNGDLSVTSGQIPEGILMMMDPSEDPANVNADIPNPWDAEDPIPADGELVVEPAANLQPVTPLALQATDRDVIGLLPPPADDPVADLQQTTGQTFDTLPDPWDPDSPSPEGLERPSF